MKPDSVPLMAPPLAWKMRRWTWGSTLRSVTAASAVLFSDTSVAPAQRMVTASMAASQRQSTKRSPLAAPAAGR